MKKRERAGEGIGVCVVVVVFGGVPPGRRRNSSTTDRLQPFQPLNDSLSFLHEEPEGEGE
ncbi:hypothetical protein D4764_04G0005030 [Takifugu flavidus]|uniref:Uncharacterized protein n=1 Tax=Takifugu flavidus TaxID=433684 RepID=A0A5C6N3M8_9TELE|nr:hypothetical protein D4764_04G0005030 [Takifugu flavidus]